MIKIYPVLGKKRSVFVDKISESYLKRNNIIFTNNIFEADIFLSVTESSRKYALLSRIFPFKKRIVWTNEPRFNTQTENLQKDMITVMNAYSGNVFFHNLHFLGSYHYDISNDLGINLKSIEAAYLDNDLLNKKNKFCAAIFAFRDPYKSQLFFNNNDIDLNSKRQSLALFMYKLDKADIYGSNWPSNVIVNDSSGYESGNITWWDSKIEILKQYKFNICLENTAIPYYCTEKIWHAIIGGCLPIYYGKGTKIYDIFPRNSFIDLSDFETNDSLLKYLEGLSNDEHLERYNMCLNTMKDNFILSRSSETYKTEIIDNFIEKIYLMSIY